MPSRTYWTSRRTFVFVAHGRVAVHRSRWLAEGESSNESGANEESEGVWGMRDSQSTAQAGTTMCAGARWIQISRLVRGTAARPVCATCRSMERTMERGDR